MRAEVWREAHGFGLVKFTGENADGASGAGSISTGIWEVSSLVFGGLEDVAIARHLNVVSDVFLAVVNANIVGIGHG